MERDSKLADSAATSTTMYVEPDAVYEVDKSALMFSSAEGKDDEEARSEIFKSGSVSKMDAVAHPSSAKPMSTASATVNLVNTIFGTGMLTFPRAFAEVGAGTGILLLLFASGMSYVAIALLLAAARKLKLDEEGINLSYYTVARRLLPNSKTRILIIDLAIAIMTFCVASAFLIVIGDVMLPAIEGIVQQSGDSLPAILLHRQVWILLFLAIMIPLAFLRRLDSLKYTALLSFVAVFYVLFVMVNVLFRMERPASRTEGVTWFKPTLKIFSSLPLFIFTFCCHQNVFSVRNEMGDRSGKRTSLAGASSLAFTSLLYIAVALAGYLAYGTKCEHNIIKSYQKDNIMVIIARFMLAALVCCAYPLQIHPCRNSLYKIYQVLRKRDPEQQINGKYFYMATALVVALTITVGMTVKSLSIVLGLAGATAGTLMVYILPGLYYLLACRAADRNDPYNFKNEREKQHTAGSRFMKAVAALTVLCGVVVAVVGILTNFVDLK